MFTIDDLADRLGSYLPDDEIRQVKRAFYFAEQAHDGQRRRSGEPYVTHPLAVANILANMHMDHQSLMAAMLHDVIEDTHVPRDALAKQFGEDVANLVDGVSKLAKIAFQDKAVAQAENLQKMVLAMSRDIRVIIVKLADRLHNMRTLGSLRPDKKRRIARETLELYARIASRLGINTIQIELEDLAFKAIYPMRAERIQRAVAAARGSRRSMMQNIQQRLQEGLDETGLQAKVHGRQKHLMSIYRKMRSKQRSFNELMDVFGFRILAKNIDDCYRILGIVHRLYKPVPGRFKDYIAIPKANGYQSLHTTLFGINGFPIEVQIRTQDMDTMANNGIAAHWLYKAGQTDRPLGDGSHARAQEWVKNLVEIQRNAGSSLEFIEHVKNDLFPDDIYVFTPKGHIMELPHNATAVDFAYAVHTDIGNSCIACRINRHLASLSAPLTSGQTVEIITAPGATPNINWLSFVVTAKARASIRHYLKHQERSDSVQLGRRLLSKALSAFGTRLEELPPGRMEAFLHEEQLESTDDLLHAIGLGNRISYSTARRLVDEQMTLDNPFLPQQDALEINPHNVAVHFSRCCYPLPGDEVIGHITAGRGLEVHRRECQHAQKFYRREADQCLALVWPNTLNEDFPSALRLDVATRRGLLAELTERINSSDADVEQIRIQEHDARLSVVTLTLAVRDRVHLARVIKRLRGVPGLERITRVINTPVTPNASV